jgi:hypothetical protein
MGLDPDDPTGEDGQNRVLALDKRNLTGARGAYRVSIESVEITGHNGRPISTTTARLGDRVKMSSKDVLNAEALHEASEKVRAAMVFIRELDLPAPSKDVEEAAKEAGISPRTLKRAREKLCIKPVRAKGEGHWTWPPITEADPGLGL